MKSILWGLFFWFLRLIFSFFFGMGGNLSGIFSFCFWFYTRLVDFRLSYDVYSDGCCLFSRGFSVWLEFKIIFVLVNLWMRKGFVNEVLFL